MNNKSGMQIELSCHHIRDTHTHTYLPCRVACMAKSPVLLQRLPRPACIELGRGDGDGAGDTELLLGESECSEPFDWWIILVRLKTNIHTHNRLWHTFICLCFRVSLSMYRIHWYARQLDKTKGGQGLVVRIYMCCSLCECFGRGQKTFSFGSVLLELL